MPSGGAVPKWFAASSANAATIVRIKGRIYAMEGCLGSSQSPQLRVSPGRSRDPEAVSWLQVQGPQLNLSRSASTLRILGHQIVDRSACSNRARFFELAHQFPTAK